MMRLNDATPADWDRVRETGEPTFESYEDNAKEVTSNAGDLTGCWVEPIKERALDAWMKAAHDEDSELWEEEEEEEEDMVGAPRHYNTGNIECIDAIEESMSSVAFKGYLKGNCMKYLWRYDYKGKQAQDLQKAGWYLNKLTAMVTEENN